MYGLIGSVLKHSYSKEIHHCFGLDDYSMFELNENEFIEKINRKDYKGLNITVPYKQKVMSLLNVIDTDAKTIGAVNTVINRDGKLYGYNTDYYGFEYLLLAHDIDVTEKKVIVLGNGGVAQPVFHYMKCHSAELVVVKRKAAPGIITYEDALKFHSDAVLIVNTSPVGMYPNIDDSPMDLDGYDRLTAVVDLIANPQETKLMQYAKEKRIQAVGGLEMLVAQAKMAEELFRDIQISPDEISKVTQVIHMIMEEKSGI